MRGWKKYCTPPPMRTTPLFLTSFPRTAKSSIFDRIRPPPMAKYGRIRCEPIWAVYGWIIRAPVVDCDAQGLGVREVQLRVRTTREQVAPEVQAAVEADVVGVLVLRPVI